MHSGPHSMGLCPALCCSGGRHFPGHSFSIHSLEEDLLLCGMLVFSPSLEVNKSFAGCSQGRHKLTFSVGLWWRFVWRVKSLQGDGGGNPSAISIAAGPTRIGRMKLEKGPTTLSPGPAYASVTKDCPPGPAVRWRPGRDREAAFKGDVLPCHPLVWLLTFM